MMNVPVRGGEIWLGGNLRPAVGLVALAAAGAAVGLAAAALCGAAGGLLVAICGVGLGAVAAATVLALAAARPRLERRGAAVRVRLMPLVTHDVPLEVVECVFLGSQPLDGAEDAAAADATHRVSTLVMRIAERATAWQSRPTFRGWGTWEDGNVVFDGRWCAPLSGDVARDIARRLLEARREASAGAAPPGASP